VKWFRKLYLRFLFALFRHRFHRDTGFRFKQVKGFTYNQDGTLDVCIEPEAPVNYVEYTFTIGGNGSNGEV